MTTGYPPINGNTELRIERLLDGLSAASTQNPTGLGEINSRRVEFGVAVNTSADPVNLLADGTLQINTSGLYRLKVSLIYGRLSGGGTAELRFRVLVNGNQVGQSIGVDINTSKLSIPFIDEAWINIEAGTTITYEIMRESTGDNTGGLIRPPISVGTAPTWNPVTCAAIRVERWVNI